MSNDLIGRREVAEFMFENRYCTSINNAIDQLKAVPTAYDVESVTEQLEKRVRTLKKLNLDDEIVDVAIKEIQKDIEIVRSGCMNTVDGR